MSEAPTVTPKATTTATTTATGAGERRSVTRIVSGGQTGADRGALDAALALGIEHGGYCPRGRRAEDGSIPAHYQLRETDSRDYAVRTERNIIESDGTLIVSFGPLTGGSALTRRLARKHRKPVLHIELDRGIAAALAPDSIRSWLRAHDIATLNVAGPRASHAPAIADAVHQLLLAVFRSSPDSSDRATAQRG